MRPDVRKWLKTAAANIRKNGRKTDVVSQSRFSLVDVFPREIGKASVIAVRRHTGPPAIQGLTALPKTFGQLSVKPFKASNFLLDVA